MTRETVYLVRFIYNEQIVAAIRFKDKEQVDAAFASILEARNGSRRLAVFDSLHGKASVSLDFLAAWSQWENLP